MRYVRHVVWWTIMLGVMLGIRIFADRTFGEKSTTTVVLTAYGIILLAGAAIIWGKLNQRRHPDGTNGI